MSTTSYVLTLHLKQAFPPIIRIFTEGEGDGIDSRQPFKIFATLLEWLQLRSFGSNKLSTERRYMPTDKFYANPFLTKLDL